MQEWLQDQLPPEVVMAHQTIGTSIVNIHLKVAMRLIPHQAQRFAELVSLFQELPQMVV